MKTSSIKALVAVPDIAGYRLANGGVSMHLKAQLVLMACADMAGGCAAGLEENLITTSSVDALVATANAAGYNAATVMQQALCSVMHAQHAFRQGSLDGMQTCQEAALQMVRMRTPDHNVQRRRTGWHPERWRL